MLVDGAGYNDFGLSPAKQIDGGGGLNFLKSRSEKHKDTKGHQE